MTAAIGAARCRDHGVPGTYKVHQKLGQYVSDSALPRSKDAECFFDQFWWSQRVDVFGDPIERESFQSAHPVLLNPQAGSGKKYWYGMRTSSANR